MTTAEKVDITKLLPSELLRLAVTDVRKCWRSPRYRVDMSCWHLSGRDNVCEVCVAGALMAMTLGGKHAVELSPERFGTNIKQRLYALNCFRMGDVFMGLIKMGVSKEQAISVHDSMRDESWFLTFETRALYSAGLREESGNLGRLLTAMTWLVRQLKKRGL